LEGIRSQIAALQGVEGSETATQALQDLASTLVSRISSLEPIPTPVPLHVQADRLQRKLKKKKKYIRDLKEKIMAARQVLRDMSNRFAEARADWDRISHEYHNLGPTIMDPPSSLPSEWEEEQDGSEYEESVISADADPHSYPLQQVTSEDAREQWQPVKKRKGRPNGQGNIQDPTEIQMQANQQPPVGEGQVDMED
jgi:hypothetical protein